MPTRRPLSRAPFLHFRTQKLVSAERRRYLLRVTPADFPALREVKLFRTMSPNDRVVVDGILNPRALRAGSTLFIEGEPGDSMVILARGRLAIVSSVGDSERVIAEVNAGEFVGEMACIDPAPRSATVRAIDDVVLFELSRADLARLRRASPGAASALTGEIIQEVTKRLRSVDEKIERSMSGGLLSSGLVPVANSREVQAAVGSAVRPMGKGAGLAHAPRGAAAPKPQEERSVWQRFIDKVRGGG